MSASLSATAERLAYLARHHAARSVQAQQEGLVYVLEPADYAELAQRADGVLRHLPDPNVPPIYGDAQREGRWWDPRYTPRVYAQSSERSYPGRPRWTRGRAQRKADSVANGLTGILVRLGIVETGHACQALRVDLQSRE